MATLEEPFKAQKIIRHAAVLTLVGAGIFGLGILGQPTRALHAYLTAYTFAASIALGALIFLLVGHAAGVVWVAPLRRLNEMVAFAVLPLALLFLPVALGIARLYPWVAPAEHLGHHGLELLREKRAYLNVPFFLVRALGYFLVWGGVVAVLRRWSKRREQAEASAAPAPGRELAFSALALIPVAFATTFAAFDWLMSLQPEWYSTMFGVYYFSGGFLAAFALLAFLGHQADPQQARLTPAHFHALGRLMFAFLCFWAYCAFFQAMLIALANKPGEVLFYTARLGGHWGIFLWILALGHFAIPFFLLLQRSAKRRARFVAAVALWMLLMHLAETYWLVMPLASPRSPLPSLQLIGALLLVLGGCVLGVAWAYRGRPWLALGDPKLQEGLDYQGGGE